MQNLIGQITASLIEKDLSISDELVDRINANIKPPEKIGADDVFIRAMFIVSDKVNSYGGCIPVDEHERLSALLIDSPVLIGHRKDTLPIARNFHAEPVLKGDTHWVKVYFYWLKNSDRGDDLRKNIDGGIYKECSISFIFAFPQCSICGADIRECPHRPFESYDIDGEKREAYFNYRRIEKVLETSLVYRGAVEDTSVTKELVFSKNISSVSKAEAETISRSIPKRIWDLHSLDRNTRYLVSPIYESVKISLMKSPGQVCLMDSRGLPFNSQRAAAYLGTLPLPEGNYILDGCLIGLRGKERQPADQLARFLQGENSTVKRLTLRFCNIIKGDGLLMATGNNDSRRTALEKLLEHCPELLVPAKLTAGSDLESALKMIGSRGGAEIADCESDDKYVLTHRRLVPCLITGKEQFEKKWKYSLSCKYGNDTLNVKQPVTSFLDLTEGHAVEVEVHSISMTNKAVTLVHPDIMPGFGDSLLESDITLLPFSSLSHKSPGSYKVHPGDDGDIMIAIVKPGLDDRQYLVHRFSRQLLETGRRFLAETNPDTPQAAANTLGSGTVLGSFDDNDTSFLQLQGFFDGHYAFRKARLHGKDRHLFFQLSDKSRSGEHK